MMRMSSMQGAPEWRRENGGHSAAMDTAANGDIEGCVEATESHLAKVKARVLKRVERQAAR